MRGIILFLFFIPVTFCFQDFSGNNQKADSLVFLLQEKSDSARIPVLLSLSWELRNTAPGKSVTYGMEAIDLATRYNDYGNLAKAYSFVGVAYRIMGRYSESIDFYYKGHDIADKFGIPEQAGYAHLNLANLYIYQEHSALAFENIKTAEKTAVETDNHAMLAYVYLFYGRAYMLDGKPDSALISYEKSLSIRQKLNQISEQSTCYKYIGDIYFEKGQYPQAIDNYNRSLEKIDRQNDKDLYSSILIKKSRILLKENRLQEASDLAHQGLDIAGEIRANLAIRDALQVLAEVSAKMQDYKSTSAYQKRVIQYNDTLFSQKLSEKIFSLEYQSEKQQREIKIDLLNKDNAIKELQINRIKTISFALTSIIILLIALFIVVLILFKHRRDRARLLEEQNKEIRNQRNSIEQQNRRLVEANDRLEKSEDDLKKTVQTRDKLFSIIAHDLRNPFTAMVGLTELLQDKVSKPDSGDVAEFAAMIHDSSLKLLNLNENLLQWAQSQTGGLKIIPKVLSLKSTVDEVLKILLTQAETKGISLRNEIPDNLSVFADYESLAVIIRNLVSNGIKYTEKNGIVTLTASQQNGTIVIKVSDTGVGIDPMTLGKLFKIEESFSTEGTSHEAGTGLGLIICKEFAEKNGGTITVDSKPGEGTTFTLTMPANIS